MIVTRPRENEKKEGSYAAILCTMPNCKLRYLPKNMSLNLIALDLIMIDKTHPDPGPLCNIISKHLAAMHRHFHPSRSKVRVFWTGLKEKSAVHICYCCSFFIVTRDGQDHFSFKKLSRKQSIGKGAY